MMKIVIIMVLILLRGDIKKNSQYLSEKLKHQAVEESF